MLTVYSPAKLNLVLEVLGEEDHYHRISTIMQSITLCDTLDFELSWELRFECDDPALESDNLVAKAASLLQRTTACDKGVYIKLHKRIPWGMGLGGGSSNAAAALLTLNELWRLRLPLSRLVSLACTLGSDVPFFLYKGTALVEGKGEKVTPLLSLPLTYFVLLVPPLPRLRDKTKRMYGRLDSSHFTQGQFVQRALSSLAQGRAVTPGVMFNVFEKIAFDVFPALKEYWNAFLNAGAASVHLAGSGPCLFSFFSEEKEARKLCSRLKSQGLSCYLACSFP